MKNVLIDLEITELSAEKKTYTIYFDFVQTFITLS